MHLLLPRVAASAAATRDAAASLASDASTGTAESPSARSVLSLAASAHATPCSMRCRPQQLYTVASQSPLWAQSRAPRNRQRARSIQGAQHSCWGPPMLTDQDASSQRSSMATCTKPATQAR
eukprot:TRINITY_DN19554_c0_g1_i2.p2 TRINITY_DN19554_c0_g1~~TRINITY_DN19554_c0_g1_i2.p2  ORF type:complete len:122 (-),score=6.23 TRINITY_DN19554_c0_g1_i2:32-397(-)